MKKLTKPNVGHFYIETWQINVYVLWPATSAGIRAFLRGMRSSFGETDWPSVEDSRWGGKCLEVNTSKGQQIIIALAEWDSSPASISTLAHEAFHAAEYILERKRVPHCENTSEVYAYLTGSIVRRCADLLPKPKRL